MPAQNSFAQTISVDVIPTEFGLKINFKNYISDFDISYSEGFLDLKFKDDVEFSGLGKLSNYKTLIKTHKETNVGFQLLFTDENIRVQKFKDSNSSGVYVFLTKDGMEKLTKQKDISESPPKEVKKDNKKETKTSEVPKNIKVNDKLSASNNEVKNPNILDVQLQPTDVNKVRVLFNWNKPVGAAAYVRSGKLWVVFDSMSEASIPEVNNSIIKSIKPEDVSREITAFTFDVGDEILSKLNKLMYREGNKWVIEISSGSVEPKGLRILSKPFAAPRPRVEIEMIDKASGTQTFIDPYIGDQITVVTTTESASTNLTARSFVDFAVPVSIQGAIIERKNDSLIISKRDNIIRIEGAASINIAPQVLEKREKKFESSVSSFKLDEFSEDYQTILSLRSYVFPGDILYEKIMEIRKRIRESEDGQQRARLYANWAMLYIANQLYTEAEIVIALIKSEDQEMYNSYQVKVMDIALHFMKKDLLNAYKISRTLNVHTIPISLRKEARFWQAITTYAVTGTDDYMTKLDPVSMFVQSYKSFLNEYTDEMNLEIGLMLAQLQLKNKELQSVRSILNKINTYELKPYYQNQLYRLTANFYADASNSDKAIEFWNKCIDDVMDHYNTNLCRYEKALYMNSTSRISKQDLIDELEKIASSWRGDDLEVSTLQLLGDTYYDIKNYPQAMRMWNIILEAYPFSPAALEATRKMSKTFVAFFTEGRDQTVSDLEAAAFFFEFEKIIPVGDLGDEVALKLSKHLVALDLLDKASQILNHQIMNRLKGTKREVAINLLSRIYVDDDMPSKALDIIDYGDDFDELPDEIAKERKHIQALAYHMNSEDGKALELLQGDFSKESDEIKALIHWDRKNWKEFNDYVEPRIYEIRDLEGEISAEDTEKVLKLAISYMIQGQDDLLDDLYEDFNGRFPKEGLSSFAIETLSTTWNLIRSDAIESLKDIPEMINKVNKLIEDIKQPRPM